MSASPQAPAADPAPDASAPPHAVGEHLRSARPAPDALAPPPGNPRFPLFDSLRAIAALSIVVTHCSGLIQFNHDNPLGAYTARMNIGVTIFFLISAFLLYRPFVRAAYHGVATVRLGDFARRRALRIVPAYWVALTVIGLTLGLTDVFTANWWKYYGFLQIYSSHTILFGIGPAWSLCIEVTFYALLPVYAWLMRRAYRAWGRTTGVRLELVVLGVLALITIVGRSIDHADGTTVFPSTLPGTFDWFAAGMILAVLSVRFEGRERSVVLIRVVVDHPWLPWLGAAVAFWFLSTQIGLPRSFPPAYTGASFLGEHVLYALVSFLLLAPAVFGDWAGGWPRRLLAWRLLSWLGLISYGIYLWHVPWIFWLNDHGFQDLIPHLRLASMVLSAAVVAGACAAASYYLVERPLLRLKDRRPPPPRAGRAPVPAEAGRAG